MRRRLGVGGVLAGMLGLQLGCSVLELGGPSVPRGFAAVNFSRLWGESGRRQPESLLGRCARSSLAFQSAPLALQRRGSHRHVTHQVLAPVAR